MEQACDLKDGTMYHLRHHIYGLSALRGANPEPNAVRRGHFASLGADTQINFIIFHIKDMLSPGMSEFPSRQILYGPSKVVGSQSETTET